MCRGVKRRVGVGVGCLVSLIHYRGRSFHSHVRQSCNRMITSYTSSNPIKLSVVSEAPTVSLPSSLSTGWDRPVS